MAINNKAQAKNREELLAKGLFNNGQKPSSLKETKKTLSPQSSVRQTDILSKAPKIPPVANLSVPTKQLNEKPPEIKPQTSQRNIPSFTSAVRGLAVNATVQPTNPTPPSQNTNPLAAALSNGGSGNTGPKNTGIVFIGIKSSPA